MRRRNHGRDISEQNARTCGGRPAKPPPSTITEAAHELGAADREARGGEAADGVADDDAPSGAEPLHELLGDVGEAASRVAGPSPRGRRSVCGPVERDRAHGRRGSSARSSS